MVWSSRKSSPEGGAPAARRSPRLVLVPFTLFVGALHAWVRLLFWPAFRSPTPPGAARFIGLGAFLCGSPTLRGFTAGFLLLLRSLLGLGTTGPLSPHLDFGRFLTLGNLAAAIGGLLILGASLGFVMFLRVPCLLGALFRLGRLLALSGFAPGLLLPLRLRPGLGAPRWNGTLFVIMRPAFILNPGGDFLTVARPLGRASLRRARCGRGRLLTARPACDRFPALGAIILS